MKYNNVFFLCAAMTIVCGVRHVPAAEPFQFRDLFNGKDLSGWVDVNTAEDTWTHLIAAVPVSPGQSGQAGPGLIRHFLR